MTYCQKSSACHEAASSSRSGSVPPWTLAAARTAYWNFAFCRPRKEASGRNRSRSPSRGSGSARLAPHHSVTVTYGEGVLDLEITDSGPVHKPAPGATAGGFGLTGMLERLGVHGGRLEAGHDGAGGFRVHAILPLTTQVMA
jgi:hypothetical protein